RSGGGSSVQGERGREKITGEGDAKSPSPASARPAVGSAGTVTWAKGLHRRVPRGFRLVQDALHLQAATASGRVPFEGVSGPVSEHGRPDGGQHGDAATCGIG